MRATLPASKHQMHIKIAQWPRNELDQKRMIFVRMRDCRVHQHVFSTYAKSITQLGGGRAGITQRRLDTVAHHADFFWCNTKPLHHCLLDVIARHHDVLCALHRSRHAGGQIAQLYGRKILRIHEVLQVVNGEHDRSRAAWWYYPTAMMHDICTTSVGSKPRCFTPDPQRPTMLRGC